VISDLAVARAAFRHSTNSTEALLATARARLQIDNAPVEASRRAVASGQPPDLEAAQQAVLDALQAAPAARDPNRPHVDKTV
jgi:hypothetical protein